ncbi:M-phase inducer phosphatase 2 (CDC25A) [Vairimorpha necatrix]|uniref:M-phase inducer phosphatase n=1 Tax=Vairimorpha necatrix TaxID=6039 RepID=A0AAX4J936_9MICR
MCSSNTNSSSILSSENDFQYENRDIYNEKPFACSYDFSSDEITNCGLEYDPFSEKILYNKKKEKNWLLQTYNFKKTFSLPHINRKYLKDFYRESNNGEIFSLPTLGTGRSDSIQRISACVLNDLINNKYNIDYTIVDCRFPYEYEGGHIKNAINVNNTKKVKGLFKNPKILIFHCEYSSVRAPKLAHYVRNLDRKKNAYPKLTLPEIYILQGGYKEFYSQYSEMCTPCGYVSMGNIKHDSRK